MTHGTSERSIEELDLTPSPRLLEILGDIPYQPWQCLAELIDNAFDDFIADTDRSPGEAPTVRVTLPGPRTSEGDEIVCVADNGRGMTREILERSLRAGYSSNFRYGSLGLFGMGFNIATAKLGGVTEVRTTRAGDETWLVAEIDFKRMREEQSFAVPLRREPKPDPSVHGTEVTVSRLRRETRDRFKRQSTASQIRERLGNVYSYMLRSSTAVPELPGPMLAGRGFALYVNNIRVSPRLPCVWSPSRKVDYRGQEIPAVVEIDRRLEPAWACMDCGRWHPAAPDRCRECGGENLQLRERRIVGWVGVQRYLDVTDFGIDLLRNGRKVLISDKSLFGWEHPDTGQVWTEYPVEFGATTGGRIVGEIHLDHVPVVYQKNDFERGSIDWVTAINYIRGEGPLQPKKAREVGYPDQNMSPLGRIFHGFRRNDAGTKCLIPGDGTKPLHERAREWATQFRKGQAEYLSDDKWWEQAVEHDRIRSGQSRPRPTPPRPRGGSPSPGPGGVTPGPAGGPGTDGSEAQPGGGDVLDRTGLAGLFGGPDAPQPPTPQPPPETEEERFARYRSNARPMHDLCGGVSVANLPRREVVAYATAQRLIDSEGRDVPCASRSPRGNRIELFVNIEHEVFRDCGRDPRDYAIIELAEVLRTQARGNEKIAGVAADITARMPDQRFTDAALRQRIDALLQRIREALAPVATAHPGALWACLPIEAKSAAERNALATDPRTLWPDLTTNGGFVDYLGIDAVAAVVRTRPELVLDGTVFLTTWSSWSSPEARDRQVERLARRLETLGEFVATTEPKSRLDLAITRLTVDKLDEDIRWETPT
ncbi:ATP-binding protein [Micromonospora sp. NPDC047730]|uniref:ATP-binding protein n=1 Tax=Micromonospora sp. NPDC047730 TaxID=3364253 RepID=UPI00370FD575